MHHHGRSLSPQLSLGTTRHGSRASLPLLVRARRRNGHLDDVRDVQCELGKLLFRRVMIVESNARSRRVPDKGQVRYTVLNLFNLNNKRGYTASTIELAQRKP